MKWQLELSCSVWRREQWIGGQVCEGPPQRERTFKRVVRDAQDQHELSCALAHAAGQCEQWLRMHQVHLNVNVVHVMYTLEVYDEAA